MKSVVQMAILVALMMSVADMTSAHEMRPSLLELTPQGEGRVMVRFSVGYAKMRPMALEAKLPSHCVEVMAPVQEDRPPVLTRTWIVDCGADGVVGEVGVDGLVLTGTDVIMRAPSGTFVLRPDSSSVILEGAGLGDSGGRAVTTYIPLGVQHILEGPDHLFFILGLVLLVGFRWRRLLETVTAFTLAHSATLALATLDIVTLAPRAVEAAIALSIVALAVEVVREEPAVSNPWVFAFLCGLLHGFGFAGVLGEVGLPHDAVPAALLGFNLGVEIGQLIFVVGLLTIGAVALRLNLERGRVVIIYLMGGAGAFWFLERALPIIQPWIN